MSKVLSISVVALALLWLASPTFAADPGKGNILVEEWFTSTTGNQVTDNCDTLHAYINAGNPPSRGYWAKALDRPDGGEDYWGGRMRGWLYPPQTGDYTFWTVGDDDSEVWLSTDETPANVKMICNVEGWENYQNWTYSTGTSGPNVKSKAIPLQAGKKYYIEVYYSDGTGGGCVTVGWGGPGIGTGPIVVDGKYLAPVVRDPEPMFMAQGPSPADGATGVTMGLLTWTPGATAMWHNVYFGTDAANLPLVSFPGNTWTMYYHMSPLEAGATYYWRVDEVEVDSTVRAGTVWKFTVASKEATSPSPRNTDKWIANNATLSWTAGMSASTHAVYFGTDQSAVTNRDASVSKGTVAGTTFTPGALADNTTYYWAVDETDMAGAKSPGAVWSFTTVLPGAGGVKGEYFSSMTPGGKPALARIDPGINFSWGDPGGPGAPIGVDQFSARWTADLEVLFEDDYTFITTSDDGARLWLNDQLIVDTWVDQASTDHFSTPQHLKTGVYSLRMEYYENGGGAVAQLSWRTPTLARQIIPAGPLQLPLKAKPAYPQNGDVDVAQNVTLTWLAGEKAAKHLVFFGTDKDAVANATTPDATVANTDDLTFSPGALEWNTTYYWRVDEVNDAAADSPWVGSVFSFTTANSLIVDNMETYTDVLGFAIFDAWVDGYADKNSGSVVGYDAAPFAERTIVHGGAQSMPFLYDNTGQFSFSEATQTFGSLQDWTVNGVTDLSVWVRGYAAPASVAITETGGKMSLTGAGTDIWGASDQFTFAYKALTGDATIQAKVTSNGTGSNTWAKGGVMIRDSLDGNAASVQIGLTGSAGNGACFQNRATAGLDMGANDATSNVTTATVVAPPYWVKLERKGDMFTGYLSANGTSWTILGTTNVAMAAPVYIGMFVTSHQAGENRTYEFESISSTGGVSGSWQGAEVMSAVSNGLGTMYVTVEDSAGKKATVTNATIVNAAAWTEWKAPLSDFAGVNLAKVKKLTVGVRDAGGSGRIFIDDIRVSKP